MACTSKHLPDLVYCNLTEDRIAEAAELMTQAFTKGEPMTVCLQIPFEAELMVNNGICKRSCSHGLAKIAIDRRTDKLVGVTTAFLGGAVREDSKIFGGVSSDVLEYYKPIHALLNEVESLFPDYSGYKNNPDCIIMESAKIAVHADYAGQGIATKLADLRMELAKKAGCAFAVVEASGPYSQKMYAKLGFKTMGEIKYSDFRYRGETPFKNITGCESMKLMLRKV